MKCEWQPEIPLPETGLKVREEVIFTYQGRRVISFYIPLQLSGTWSYRQKIKR
jgi:hypothetical protein